MTESYREEGFALIGDWGRALEEAVSLAIEGGPVRSRQEDRWRSIRRVDGLRYARRTDACRNKEDGGTRDDVSS